VFIALLKLSRQPQAEKGNLLGYFTDHTISSDIYPRSKIVSVLLTFDFHLGKLFMQLKTCCLLSTFAEKIKIAKLLSAQFQSRFQPV
jgi:hypothetical protein